MKNARTTHAARYGKKKQNKIKFVVLCANVSEREGESNKDIAAGTNMQHPRHRGTIFVAYAFCSYFFFLSACCLHNMHVNCHVFS